MNTPSYPQKLPTKGIVDQPKKLPFSATDRLAAMLLIITGLASAPLQLISGRQNVDEAMRMYGNVLQYSAHFTWLSRLLNGVIAILLILLIKRVISTRSHITIGARNISAALGVFLVCNYGLGSLFGLYPGLPNPYLLLGVIALILLSLTQALPPQKLIDIFRYVASSMVIGSLLVSIFVPKFSYMADFSNLSAAIGSKRLIGLFSHPSQLGLYALMLFAIELRLGAKGWLRLVNLFVCPVVLVLSVSKTAIALATILLFWHFAKNAKLYAFMMTFFLIETFVYVLMTPNVLLIFSGNKNIRTLTGRTSLWNSIIDSFVANPFFGNGPAFFSGNFHLGYAHAHNIILQSVSDGGLFGLIGLIGYIFALVSIALKNKSASRSLSIALVLLLLAFSMTEPAMRVDSFLSGLYFINAFVILYLCALDFQRNGQGKKDHLVSHQHQEMVKA